jgi:hypothetical protein
MAVVFTTPMFLGNVTPAVGEELLYFNKNTAPDPVLSSQITHGLLLD